MKTCFKKWHEKENKLKILAPWTRTALEPDASGVSSTWKMAAERIRNDAWEVTRGHSLNQDLKSRNWFIWLEELPKLHNMWNRQSLWKIQVWHWWTRAFCPVHLVLVFWSWGSHRLANALLSRWTQCTVVLHRRIWWTHQPLWSLQWRELLFTVLHELTGPHSSVCFSFSGYFSLCSNNSCLSIMLPFSYPPSCHGFLKFLQSIMV